MKICLYGTTRIDLHIFQNTDKDITQSEQTIFDLSIKVGGSVFNTMAILSYAKFPLTYYTFLGNDIFIEQIKSLLENFSSDCIYTSVKSNPMSFLFIDNKGEKKILSYDPDFEEEPYDLISKNMDVYDVFYFSCYSINENNSKNLSVLLKNFKLCKKIVFMDLSPLAYRIDEETWNGILPYISHLSGTQDEFNILCNIVRVKNEFRLKEKYGIDNVYIKKDKNGSTIIDINNTSTDYAVEFIDSSNYTGCGDAYNAGIIWGNAMSLPQGSVIELAHSLAGEVAKNGLDFLHIVKNVKNKLHYTKKIVHDE